MPVIVVGAASPFGYDLIDALIATGGQVRVFLREPDPVLAGKPVHRAIGALDDVERLEAACAQVHTLIHLTGRRSSHRPAEETEALEVTAISAHAADVTRVVVVVPDPPTGRLGRRISDGLAFLDGRNFETSLVSEAPKVADVDLIEAILAADARDHQP